MKLTPKYFFVPMLQALSEATGHKTGVFVDFQGVVDRTLEIAKIDPNSYFVPRKSASPPGLDRLVSLAFRYLREKTPAQTEQGSAKGI